MKENYQLINYIHSQRWCGFKQAIAEGKVIDVNLDSVPFDNGQKFFTLGEATLENGEKKVFFMPLAIGHLDGVESVNINGEEMFDATRAPDYWNKLTDFFKENKNKVTFSNGAFVKYFPIGEQDVVKNNFNATSKPLNVEQSNTTIKVGDSEIAFKQDRMIESDFGVSTEVEMNAKLMEGKCSAMPKTYGAFIMKEPDGKVATIGIVQEFVPNRGDLWEFANHYLVAALKEAETRKLNVIDPNEHRAFIEMMKRLGNKTTEMSECLSKPNGNPDFEPEAIDATYLYGYRKNLDVLLYQTKETIQNNIENLSGETKSQTENLLRNWDNLTQSFVNKNISLLESGQEKSKIVRVHGDFHLGQVLVTKDGDLKFLDFAGEPGLPLTERKKKHPETRDVAGMYRSISGYLGPVVAETFAATGETVKRANGSDKNVTDPTKEAWANRAIASIIEHSTAAFMNGKSEQQPMMALEILRKNLYEVGYEVGNRPDLAHIPVKGLVGLLNGKSNERAQQMIKTDHKHYAAAIKNNNDNNNMAYYSYAKTGNDL